MRPTLPLAALLLSATLPAQQTTTHLTHVPADPAAARSTSLPVTRISLYKNGVGYFEHTGFVSGNASVTLDFTSGPAQRRPPVPHRDRPRRRPHLRRRLQLHHTPRPATQSPLPRPRPEDDLLRPLHRPARHSRPGHRQRCALHRPPRRHRDAQDRPRQGRHRHARRPLRHRRLRVGRRPHLPAHPRPHRPPPRHLRPHRPQPVPPAPRREPQPGPPPPHPPRPRPRPPHHGPTPPPAFLHLRSPHLEVHLPHPLHRYPQARIQRKHSPNRLDTPAQTATLQGWSVVDNTTGIDWINVHLSLIAGAPQSFIQPLSQPIYSSRPEIPIAQDAQLTPQTFESGEEKKDRFSAEVLNN